MVPTFTSDHPGGLFTTKRWPAEREHNLAEGPPTASPLHTNTHYRICDSAQEGEGLSGGCLQRSIVPVLLGDRADQGPAPLGGKVALALATATC